MDFHPKHLEWIEARGLDPYLLNRLGVSTRQEAGRMWLAVPYLENGQERNCKFRGIKDKAHMMTPGAPLLWWNVDCLHDPRVQSSQTPVIITEGEWDAMVAIQCGHPFALSVPNGADERETTEIPTAETDAERYRFFWRSKALTDNIARFIIATDGDAPGRNLAHELVMRLGAHRCAFVEYPEGCKDLNDVMLEHGTVGVTEVINAAKPYPVRGLYRMADFPEPPPLEVMRVRLPHLHDALPIVRGTFGVYTGYAGRGKTSLIMAMVADLMRQGVTVAIGSFETFPKPIMRDALRGHLMGAFHGNLTPAQKADADAIMDRHLCLIAQHPDSDENDFTLTEVLDLCSIAVLRDGAKVIFLDPWNEIEHKRKPDESETEYTGRAIREMKRFARRYAVSLNLVAHPKKPDMTGGSNVKPPTLYDISGSANFANKADYGVVIDRPKKDSNITDIHVVKVRMGLPGTQDSYELQWDWQRSRYDRALSIHDMDA